jgi:hypothetical protein
MSPNPPLRDKQLDDRSILLSYDPMHVRLPAVSLDADNLAQSTSVPAPPPAQPQEPLELVPMMGIAAPAPPLPVNPSRVSAPIAADRPAPVRPQWARNHVPAPCMGTLLYPLAGSPLLPMQRHHLVAPTPLRPPRMLYQQIWSLLLVLRSMQYWNWCLTLLHTHTAPDFSTTFASPNNTQMALLHTLRYGPLIQLLFLTLLLLIILFGDGLWMISIVLS